ncbi:MAG TPA: hypothetical protein VGK47_02195 [Nitrososphaeraceae archaeon]
MSKQKVYILLEYPLESPLQNVGRIVGVYADEASGTRAQERNINRFGGGYSYHLIKKSVQGTIGVNFGIPNRDYDFVAVFKPLT